MSLDLKGLPDPVPASRVLWEPRTETALPLPPRADAHFAAAEAMQARIGALVPRIAALRAEAGG